nr:hypothetical protein [uncultured Desulfobacter sp.]
MEEISQQQISEIITLNRQIGEIFRIKMKNGSATLLGIPVPASDDPEKFTINLLNSEPGRIGRFFEGRMEDIRFFEKV